MCVHVQCSIDVQCHVDAGLVALSIILDFVPFYIVYEWPRVE